MKKGNNEGSIRRRSNGTWEGRYSDGRDDNGRQIQRSVYGKTRKEVAEKLNAVLHNKQTGSYVTPSKTMLKEWPYSVASELRFCKCQTINIHKLRRIRP